MAVLKLGSQGAEVRNLQMVLAELGFKITPDGDFGSGTKAAVIAAQKSMGLTADGIVGPSTWDGLDNAYQPGTDNFTSSGELTITQIKEAETPAAPDDQPRLAGVHPALADRAMAIIAAAAADGYTLRVSQGVRTFAEQDALYAQGRTVRGKRVTNARGGQSMHNYGLAVDFVFLVGGKVSWDEALYTRIGAWADRAGGCEWGGRWRFADKPHVQLADLPSTATLLTSYNNAGKGREGIAAVWAHHVKASALSSRRPPSAPTPPASPRTGAPIVPTSPNGKWTLADAGVIHAAIESLYDAHRGGRFDQAEVRSWMAQEVIPALRAGQDPNKVLNYLDGELAKGG